MTSLSFSLSLYDGYVSYETSGMPSEFLAIIAFRWHFILFWEEFLLAYFVFIFDVILSNHSSTGWE